VALRGGPPPESIAAPLVAQHRQRPTVIKYRKLAPRVVSRVLGESGSCFQQNPAISSV